jgi:hypothetical protein
MKLSFSKNILALACLFAISASYAQPGTTIDLEKQKPDKYKEKLLKSEKTEEKKISGIKHFFSNTVSHYNYYYNANIKLQDILEKAKETYVDDYSKFLSFYNYSLNATATDKNIDSVIYKCNAGILLHDLRSDWVDDLYMMLGKAYLYRKDFDSAYYVFQYINYIYAPKDDGYDIPIGSNANNEDGIFTVSTNEKKRPFIQKVILRKPLERNTAFIWLIRNHLEQRKLGEASSLISILKNDPYFPKRLGTDLNEMTAYYYYLQQQYDSSAIYLEKSLDNAVNRIEKSRWEFLCGQMYQKGRMYDDANRLFIKAIKHSANPLVDVYAHLNMIGQYGDTTTDRKSKAPQGDVYALDKLAKRERYANYRDIIYYAAGKISLQQKDKQSASDYFLKSAKSSVDNPVQKSKSYLALADLKYEQKQYKAASGYYDSVVLKNIDSVDVVRVVSRKPALKIITKNIDAIYLQDSLQMLAKMAPKDLNLLLKKIYKQYKKDKGAKDDAGDAFDFGSDNAAVSTTPTGFQIEAKPGEFYFANEALKAQGSKDFKSRWGNRPNVDNWNRAAAAATGKLETDKKNGLSDAEKSLVEKQTKANKNASKNSIPQDQLDPSNMALGSPDVALDDSDPKKAVSGKAGDKNTSADKAPEMTPESLFNAIPLSTEKLNKSNNIIIDALFENAETFSNKLDDYPSAIAAYEELLRRFPKNKHTEQTLFNLSYCYKRVNKSDKELAAKQKLDLDFANGNLARILKDKSPNSQQDSATKQYAGVYNMFLEGKYEEAKTAKKQADSAYKQKYWSPQLSFIESVYYIKQREDSIAINRLTLITSGNAEPQLKEKARLMIEILKKRKEIEEYLSNLDSNGHYDSALARMNLLMKDSTSKAKLHLEKERQAVLKIDSSLIGKPFFYNPNEPHYAVLLLDNVDDVFITETVTSFNKYNKEKLGNSALIVKSLKLNQQYNLILVGPLSNAPNGLTYIDDLKPQTGKILPWLPAFKYTYSLIGLSNLEILKANNNMDKYIKFLKTTFPDKF